MVAFERTLKQHLVSHRVGLALRKKLDRASADLVVHLSVAGDVARASGQLLHGVVPGTAVAVVDGRVGHTAREAARQPGRGRRPSARRAHPRRLQSARRP